MAYILKLDGSRERVIPDNGQIFTLKELQRMVNGLIEIIPLPYNCVMLVDEEARMKSRGHNLAASIQAGRNILGQAVVMDRRELGQ